MKKADNQYNDNYIVNTEDIESNENIKIRNKEIFTGNLLSKSKIISYDSLIVLGDIDCDYLLVVGDLICTGSINATEIDIEGDLFYVSYPECNKLNIEGKEINIQKNYNSDNIFEFSNIEKNIYEDNTVLNNINKLKNDIIQDLIERDMDNTIENVFTSFNILSKAFSEFKIYSYFIQQIIQLERKCESISEYLYIMNLKSQIPHWIINLSCIKDKLIYIQNIDIEKLKYDIEKEDSIIELYAYLYKSKDLLKNDYDKLMNILNRANKLELIHNNQESKNIVNNENETIKDEVLNEKQISMEDIYEKYIEKGKNRSLIIGIIKRIEDNKIIVTLEENIDATLLDIYDIGDKSIYNIGDKISAYVLKVTKKDNIEVDLYRNSKSYIYRSLNEMNIENADKIKKSNIHIINNSMVVIVNDSKVNTDFSNMEKTIRNNLKILNVKVLNIRDSKEENLSNLFNINKSSIYKNSNNEYVIDVLDLEDYRILNKKVDKSKDIIEALSISKVTVNKISIRNRYNIYIKKIGKIVRGTVINEEDNKIIIGIEGNVKAIMKCVDSNKIYDLGSEVVAKIDSISLDEDTIYLKVINNYDEFILDLIDYTIRNLEIELDYEKIFRTNNRNGLDVELEIKDNKLNTEQINDIISYINSNIDTIKDSIKLKDKITNTVDIKENVVKQDDISISTILNEFNKNKRLYGVPEARVLKNFRIPGYKTVIISSKLAIGNNKSNLKSLEYEMNMLTRDEKIKIILYNNDVRVMISDILDISLNQVDINKSSRKINIKLEEEQYNKLIKNEDKERKIIQGLFPYYNLSIEQDNNKNDVDIDIIKMLFK